MSGVRRTANATTPASQKGTQCRSKSHPGRSRGARGRRLGAHHYWVSLDLTVGAEDFASTTKVTFDAQAGASTFLDLIADQVTEVVLNGEALDPVAVFTDSPHRAEQPQGSQRGRRQGHVPVLQQRRGLHRSVDPSDGNVYLYSQFEVPDARRVYAVFDQPDLKAVFDFDVTAPESWIVLSNQPVRTVESVDGMTLDGTLGDHPAERIKRWVFEPTVTMSSYLTAICAGPYAQWHTEYENEDGRVVPMGQYCRQSLAEAFAKDGDYLFDVTKKGFAFYAGRGASRTRTPSTTRSTCPNTTRARWRTSAWSRSATPTCSNRR